MTKFLFGVFLTWFPWRIKYIVKGFAAMMKKKPAGAQIQGGLFPTTASFRKKCGLDQGVL